MRMPKAIVRVFNFKNGMTVRDLRNVLSHWPDKDENGEEYQVWIETGWCLTSQVKEIWPLNVDKVGADMELRSYAFEK
jgi:hypothetical protein